MRKLIVAEEKINSLAAALYIVGLAVLVFTCYPDLWGGLTIITGAVWLVRQFLMGRILDLFFIVVVFGGSWACHYFIFYPYYIIPGLLAVGALYVIVEQIAVYWRQGKPDSNCHLSSQRDQRKGQGGDCSTRE